MDRNIPFLVILLAALWVVFSGELSVTTAVTGLIIGSASMLVYHLFIPPQKKTKGFNFIKFTVYPLYLLLHIYSAAFTVIKLIIKGGEAEIIKVKTQLSNNFLQTVLANSYTLTPGTVSLELHDGIIEILCLRGKSQTREDTEKEAEVFKNRMEKILLKTEK